MVFQSSINPIFPDPPNWLQQHQGDGSDNHLPPHPLVSPPSGRAGGGDGGGASLIRPGSMADRARLAKIPQPDSALKCPRCESTNTKFCYFNNYNLAQPRHFCKTCRRYWTRGGALRNVPVGGGCRRNKRNKRNRSKSPVMAERRHVSSSSSNSSNTTDIIGHLATPQTQLPFFPPLHNLGDFSFRSIQPVAEGGSGGGGGGGGGGDIEFQIGTSSSGVLADQWRLQQVQQFPFLSNLEPPSTGLYSFEGGGVEPPSYAGQPPMPRPALDSISTGIATQMAAVKMEENHQGLLNLSRNFLGLPGNHDHNQYWSASTDISGFNSSSTSHFL